MKVMCVAGLVCGLAVCGSSPIYAQSPAEIVARESAPYSQSSSPQELVNALKAVAGALNGANVPDGPFGILRKTTGHNCAGFSCDIVCAGAGQDQKQWDIWIDGNPQRPIWPRAKTVADNIRVDVCSIQGSTDPGPNPGPDPTPEPPPTTDLKPIYDYLAKIDAWVQDLFRNNEQLRMVNEGQDRVIANRTERLEATEKALNETKCRALGGLIPCNVYR
jgi:hypothetical protein